jgi:HEAT repeat protein
LTALLVVASLLAVQGSSPPSAAVDPDLPTAITQLGDLDYAVRMRASRVIRRTSAAEAVPVLLNAIEQHTDGYVRYRALVLLSAFNSSQVPEVMRQAAYDPNDRLRNVAYAWFERHPDPAMAPKFIEFLERETSEFVRPALIRALAVLAGEPQVKQVLLREMNRGQDFFRSAVIEVLGDVGATWAVQPLSAIAQTDGPLQDDAALALGKIGDRRALGILAGLQRTAPREMQPTIAAAICLLGVNCDTHRSFLTRTLTFSEDTHGFQPLLRAAAAGLGAVAASGDRAAAQALFDIGAPSRDPARAPIALAAGSMAVRNPAQLLVALETTRDRAGALSLVAEGFDMLEEDLAEEQFFAVIRKTYWAAADGSEAKRVAEQVVRKMEF